MVTRKEPLAARMTRPVRPMLGDQKFMVGRRGSIESSPGGLAGQIFFPEAFDHPDLSGAVDHAEAAVHGVAGEILHPG